MNFRKTISERFPAAFPEMSFRKTISERFPAAHLSLSQVCQELSVERFPAVSQCWTYAFAATILVAG
jgi:hypothetical protein